MTDDVRYKRALSPRIALSVSAQNVGKGGVRSGAPRDRFHAQQSMTGKTDQAMQQEPPHTSPSAPVTVPLAPGNGASAAPPNNTASAPSPSPGMDEPLIQVVEAQPVIRAIERLSQHIAGNAGRIAQGAMEQRAYLDETKRAHNAMTSDWYKITEQLPRMRVELARLDQDLDRWHAELARLDQDLAQWRADIAQGPRLIRRTVAVTAGLVAGVVALLLVVAFIVLWVVAHHQILNGLS